MKIGYVMQEGGPDVRQKPRTGPANHVFRVFRELQDLGNDVRFLARWDNAIWRSDDLVTFDRVFVKACDRGLTRAVERTVRGLQSRLRWPYLNLFESHRFARACEQELGDRDVFYERLGWMGYGTGMAARRLRIPLTLEVNNGDFVTELEMLKTAPHGFQRWLAIKLMSRAVGKAAAVVATGEGHRRRFMTFWKPSVSVVTIENGTELVDLLGRQQLGAFSDVEPSDRPVTVAFLGAFEPWQGVLELLSAMLRVVSVNPDVRLVLIGSGTLWNEVCAFINDQRLEYCVTMTGQQDVHQMAQLLASADIGVAPYCGWMEYSGMKLFDYKAAALAIVASGENGQPATLAHGRTAWIVPPCSESALADAILHLAGDRNLRRTMGQQARVEAEECQSWKHTARQIQELCGEVVGHGRGIR
jgi:glycosyltransferase involved in cell wall biosynthesis